MGHKDVCNVRNLLGPHQSPVKSTKPRQADSPKPVVKQEQESAKTQEPAVAQIQVPDHKDSAGTQRYAIDYAQSNQALTTSEPRANGHASGHANAHANPHTYVHDDKENAGAKSYAFISHSQETFGSQEPRIDNASLARRRRRRTSPLELAVLESEFTRCQKPGRAVRLAIAERAGMSEKAVQIWFQNKRQACRRQAALAKEMEANGTPANSKDSQDEPNKRRRKLTAGPAPTSVVPPQQTTTSTVRQPRPIFGQTPEGNAIVGLPTPPSLSRTNSSQARPISIYNDATAGTPSPTSAAGRATSCRLSMSDDGKAEIVLGARRVLGQTAASTLNRLPTPPTSAAKKSASTPLPLGTHTDRDAECVSHLLSLRSGVWR